MFHFRVIEPKTPHYSVDSSVYFENQKQELSFAIDRRSDDKNCDPRESDDLPDLGFIYANCAGITLLRRLTEED